MLLGSMLEVRSELRVRKKGTNTRLDIPEVYFKDLSPDFNVMALEFGAARELAINTLIEFTRVLER